MNRTLRQFVARTGAAAGRHTVALVFWSKKTQPAPVADDRPERPGAKNRPTPKRRDQEAANKHPVVNTDRKAAARSCLLYTSRCV